MSLDAAHRSIGGDERVQRELVIKAQHGDADAFSVLAAGAIDRLHGIAYRVLRNADRADDATQRALIAAWDHLRDLRDPDRFDAWTYRLVVRAAYKEAQRERTQHDVVHWALQVGRAVDDPLDTVAERDRLEHAFVALSPEHRAVLALRYYADLPFAEIAAVLDIPIGTVSSRLHHALAHMREELCPEPPPVRRMEHVLR
jgi:RNA polymerase sigma-70 factor (ECF subfamily)